MQGTLPIVTDQFATVTVVPREEIQRSPGSTLGDVLFSKPGVTGSSFAPGASSRPIIRGLDVNRVGIVDNGIGGGGASDLGEDHFVPVNPLATDQIEVIRGPATLRYGSQSIGGVVSSTNNRIPDALPCGPFSPLRPVPGIDKTLPASTDQGGCTSIEGRGAGSSVDNGREGGLLFDTGAGNFAFHGDLFGRQTDNYRVPSYPYLIAPIRRSCRSRRSLAALTAGNRTQGHVQTNSLWAGLIFSSAALPASPTPRTTTSTPFPERTARDMAPASRPVRTR
jgi:iron complex outermembrane receptor protein